MKKFYTINKPICKTFIFLLLLALFSTGHHYSESKVFIGGFNGKNITYVVEDKVSSSDSKLLKESTNRWNGITSKRSLSYLSTKDKYGRYNARVKASSNYKTSNPTLLGEIIPGKGCSLLSGCQPASENEEWTSAYLRVYKHNLPKSNYSNYFRKTATHEFGHINSMAHNSLGTNKSVMSQGLSQSYSIKQYDKNQMKVKWGN